VPESFEEYARIMYDLLALSWQTDLTRVATDPVEGDLPREADFCHELADKELNGRILRTLEVVAAAVSQSVARFIGDVGCEFAGHRHTVGTHHIGVEINVVGVCLLKFIVARRP